MFSVRLIQIARFRRSTPLQINEAIDRIEQSVTANDIVKWRRFSSSRMSWSSPQTGRKAHVNRASLRPS